MFILPGYLHVLAWHESLDSSIRAGTWIPSRSLNAAGNADGGHGWPWAVVLLVFLGPLFEGPKSCDQLLLLGPLGK